MRLILTVLIVFLVIDEGLADTSREDKVAYIMETMDFGGQIAAYNDEMVKRILEGMDANPQIELEEKIKFIVIEESISIIKIITDDYIDKIAEVYVEIFSDEEIDALYNFFRSPQGQ